MNPPPEMPTFIFAIGLSAGILLTCLMAWLTLDILQAWSRTRPNERRKPKGVKIRVHNFDTQHLDP